MLTLRKDDVLAAVKTNPDYIRPTDRPQRFAPGDKVLVRMLNPHGHTRLPRYVRGRVGVVQRHQGSFVFPDTVAHGGPELPQHLYSVRFEAKQLWGDDASEKHSVYLDLWDDYIVAAK
ncbi:nitrile hydratase beta subunit [Paraburkholderia silvatlantica]|uniref:Nitrile hydratase beta subunit n=2 Tax=Paraburkholderia silvatlantica TaxID=321895 RepID=A0A2V4T7H8_9BURK|nr:nitrile hydratase beta subunit [Paraburkholderia silvatlantica]TDQ81118.1 nitrile hydratase beta subunit [Paraburkholderia silvatlantica]